jgi:uncharacterized protein DUF5655
MWTCPKCHHKFFNKNQSHSCGSYTVDDFLKGKSEKAIGLFHHLLAEYRKIGEFELHPVKTRVALLTKMRFCSINKLGEDYLNFHLVLRESYNDYSCFFKIDNLDNRFFVHHIKMQKNSDINDEVRKFMNLAYQVGNRDHITPGKKYGRY